MSFTPAPTGQHHPSGVVLSFARKGRVRTLRLGPLAIGLIIATPIFVLTASAAALSWNIFRDDVLVSLMRRHGDMQVAYEDRLAAMRAQIDRVTSRQLLDQNTLEGQVRHLLSRQAQLEARAATITALAEQMGLEARQPAAAEPQRPQPAPAPLESRPAQIEKPRPEASDKPLPEGFQLRSGLTDPSGASGASHRKPEPSTNQDIAILTRSVDRMERDQIQAVAQIGATARRKVSRLKEVITETGLSPDRLSTPSGKAIGGPFVALKADPNGSPFERELSRMSRDYEAANRLTQIVSTLPLRRPLAGRLEITSGYGPRIDPFLGRMALHAGMDIREEPGAPVRATAGGKVVAAGWSGGYGNMVEIEHENDLSTRYGHLSVISVAEGQHVTPGTILGRVGSTGRSTGPHLHYEVRIDGEAVDPGRFLRASDRVAGGR
jgi:murein DD-endopeptidase MepM/ murein hydrolase activator NlpD